jgi:hypothetical protein
MPASDIRFRKMNIPGVGAQRPKSGVAHAVCAGSTSSLPRSRPRSASPRLVSLFARVLNLGLTP